MLRQIIYSYSLNSDVTVKIMSRYSVDALETFFICFTLTTLVVTPISLISNSEEKKDMTMMDQILEASIKIAVPSAAILGLIFAFMANYNGLQRSN